MQSPLWFPYAQMARIPAPWRVESARGVRLRLQDGRELIDALSSWWCVIHGYNHPRLNRAAKEQIDRVAHVMLGGLEHAPARALAEELVAITPEGLNHVFYSDSGSVGVEIALKMAVQFWRNLGRARKCRFLALRKAYHGDTWMAMSVCDPDDGMHALFRGALTKQHFLNSPRGGFDATRETLAPDIDALRACLEAHGEEMAAFIVEPVLQAAGGFHVYSPAYLRAARALCDEYDVLLIFDEVATGFGRTGALFAAEHAGVTPDIMVLGKGLTAGYTGHAATLATTRVYEAFLGEDGSTAFMHGPTFMANPLACAVALAGLELFRQEDRLGQVRRIEEILKEELLPLAAHGHPGIAGVRVLGACGAIEVTGPDVYKGLQAFAAERGVWLRPFDNNVYTMPPYVIDEEELRCVTGVMREWFGE